LAIVALAIAPEIQAPDDRLPPGLEFTLQRVARPGIKVNQAKSRPARFFEPGGLARMLRLPAAP
jgi:hypothetical protein